MKRLGAQTRLPLTAMSPVCSPSRPRGPCRQGAEVGHIPKADTEGSAWPGEVDPTLVPSRAV